MKPVELDLDRIPRRKAVMGTPNRVVPSWKRIFRSLRLDGPQTIAALAKNLDLHRSTVEWHLMRGIKLGYAERVGRTYQLTTQGQHVGKPRTEPPRYRAKKPKPKKPTAWTHILAEDPEETA